MPHEIKQSDEPALGKTICFDSPYAVPGAAYTCADHPEGPVPFCESKTVHPDVGSETFELANISVTAPLAIRFDGELAVNGELV